MSARIYISSYLYKNYIRKAVNKASLLDCTGARNRMCKMYKKSKFNHIIKTNGIILAFNSMSCSLAEVNNDFMEILNDIENINEKDLPNTKKDLLENMKIGRYIIDSEVDELAALAVINNIGKFSHSETLTLTIAPTLACNFKCKYCYETPQLGVIGDDVSNAIVNYIRNLLDNVSNVLIWWYGGEPLLAYNEIIKLSDQIMKICAEQGKGYSSNMISNGYLFNDEKIKELKARRLKQVQITLDGSRDIHNLRRPLKGDAAYGTYDKIVSNVKRLVKANINVVIRINVDKTNKTEIDSVINNFLDEPYNKNIKFALGCVFENKNTCMDTSGECLENSDFMNLKYNFEKKIKSMKFPKHQELEYPYIKTNTCCANNVYTYVIDHKGYFYKCYNDIGDIQKAIGNILNRDTIFDLYSRSSKYLLASPLNRSECKECNMLPICMGGCPKNILNQTQKCGGIKYIIDKILIDRYKSI
jgi:uncharacterized protein